MTAAETAIPTGRGVFLTRVVSNEPICREHYRFVLEMEDFPAAAPGQFMQILCGEPSDESWRGSTFIRRPFSIGGLRRIGRRCEIDILHRAVGPGTRWLSQLKSGDAVSILGPLGRPFSVRDDRPLAYLVGGGIGLPPLIWLAQVLRGADKKVIAFVGARSGDLIPMTRNADVDIVGDECTRAFAEFAEHDAPVVLSTDDGSLGARGRIPDVFADYLDRHAEEARSAAIYTCGPDPMMHAVARIAEDRDIPCQVCLERVMACGMGTCQSCVVAVRDAAAEDGWRYRLCCTDGPVFDSRIIIWSK